MAHLLALGEDAPLAAGSYFPNSDDPWVALSEEQTEGVVAFDRLQPPLERIAALEPELIIGSSSYMEDVYDRLQEIAPAVAVNEFGDDGGWRTALMQVGETLGKQERAEQVIAEFDERMAEAREELQDAVETVSVVSVFPDTVRIWRTEVSEAEILEELGLNVVPKADEFEGTAAELGRSDRIDISRELVPEIDGQAIVLRQTLQDEEVQRALEDLQNTSLWQELPAVENDLLLVTNSLIFTGGVFGYRELLNQYVEFLNGTAQTTGWGGTTGVR